MSRCARWTGLAVALACLLAAGRASAIDDVNDPFHRYFTDNRASSSDAPDESIDPFTGNLSLVHTDLDLPGAGGFDLKIVRAYTSKIWSRLDPGALVDSQIGRKERSWMGWGWKMHQGILRNPFALGNVNGCNSDMPTFETREGSTVTFYPDAPTGYWESKNHWRFHAHCGNASGPACIWTSDGVRYEFDHANFFYYDWVAGEPNRMVPTSRMVGPQGQTITIAYRANEAASISSITDSVGRVITFNYSAATNRVTSMNANGKIWTYNYIPINTVSWGTAYFLSGVVPPAGPAWSYQYYLDGTFNNRYGLQRVTYPTDGQVEYRYGSVSFDVGYETILFNPVTRKTVSGRDITTASWNYSYYSVPSDPTARTTITRPDGRADVFEHRGWSGIGSGNVWRVGLPTRISLADGADIEALTWERGAAVSNALYVTPDYGACFAYQPVYDLATYVPRVIQRSVTRTGRTYTTDYSNFDGYEQPRRLYETGDQIHFPVGTTFGCCDRTTDIVYTYLASPRIVKGLRTSQTVTGFGTSTVDSWGYGPTGKLERETLSGIDTYLSYDGSGNLTQITAPDGRTMTLSNYNSGVPQTLAYPSGTRYRVANWEGWIIQETTPNGHTTFYGHDDLGRRTSINLPIGNDVAISYAPDGSWSRAQQGTSWQNSYSDGFGRGTGTVNSEGVSTTVSRNAMGQVSFQSYPYTGVVSGDTLQYDGLGRQTLVTHAGGSTVSTVYSNDGDAIRATTTDETGKVTRVAVRAVGHPDSAKTYTVTDPNGVAWTRRYNIRGQVTSINGPISQSFGYDGRGFLISESHTQRGSITFGRDALGRMTSLTDGRGTTSYGFDSAGRLSSINYSGTGDDATLGYDPNGNLTSWSSANGGSATYLYDALDRSTRKTWVFSGVSYVTQYGYNAAGCMDSLIYPTGALLVMSCDTQRRTTAITGWASGVTYHPSGQLASYTAANGRQTTRMFDVRTRAYRFTVPGILDQTVTFDNADNVRNVVDAVTGITRNMGYDDLYRLTSASGPWGSASFTYDAAGNRTNKTIGSASTTYAYTNGRLTSATGAEAGSFSYDGSGNMSSGGGFTYSWDGADRLASSSDGALYAYGPQNLRIKKTAAGRTLVYHHGPGNKLIAVTRIGGQKVRDTVYLAGVPIAVHGKPQ